MPQDVYYVMLEAGNTISYENNCNGNPRSGHCEHRVFVVIVKRKLSKN